ncbi:hypothetical protein JCM30566_19270 [Marinitoga arctica]
MKKILIIFLIMLFVVLGFSYQAGLTLEFREKPVVNILPDDRSFFDIFGRLDLLIFFVNVPFAENNYYMNDFSEITILPVRKINIDKIKIGLNIIKMHVGIFPFRIAAETNISNIVDYEKILITTSSGIRFGDNFSLELGLSKNIGSLLSGNLNLNWIFGFNIMIY